MFHRTLHTQAISVEMLNKVDFVLMDGYIVFEDSKIKRKMKPIAMLNMGEEQFASKEDRSLMARWNMKRAVVKILIKLQAYKFNQQIIRNQKSKNHLADFGEDLEEDDFSYCGESYYEESDHDDGTLETLNEESEKSYRSDRPAGV